MDEFAPVRKILTEHKKKFPRSRRYPKEFWDGATVLANQYGVAQTAIELHISKIRLLL